MNRGQSAPPRTKADCADELVDLAISLSIDGPAYLALHTTFDPAREPTTLVSMLDGLNVPEVSGKTVKL
jgi:hypothetical protein